MRAFALSQALLLGGHFDAALPAVEQAYAAAAPIDPQMPVLLAWCDLKSGRAAQAAPLLAHYPIPGPGGIDIFAAGWFPRAFYLRGLAAEQQGKAEEARANFKLFLALSGDAPLAWAEEADARARLR